MRLSSTIAALALLASGAAHAADQNEDVARHVRRVFPQLTVTSVSTSPIAGVYEIAAGSNLIYFDPASESVIFGEIFSKEGKSLTAERMQQLAAAHVKDLPIEKAVRIGDGPITIIEFTDPDCPYCRKADEHLKSKPNVTRLVFFYPLPSHPGAATKARYVLCSIDRAKAYEAVMSGSFDSTAPSCADNAEAARLLAEHMEIGRSFGVKGTPTFVVNGEVIQGADVVRIDRQISSLDKGLNPEGKEVK